MEGMSRFSLSQRTRRLQPLAVVAPEREGGKEQIILSSISSLTCPSVVHIFNNVFCTAGMVLISH